MLALSMHFKTLLSTCLRNVLVTDLDVYTPRKAKFDLAHLACDMQIFDKTKADWVLLACHHC
jgi:hypothetical protein